MKNILKFIRKIILKLLNHDHHCYKCKHWNGRYTSGRCGRFPKQAFIRSYGEKTDYGIEYYTAWEYPEQDMHDSCGEFKPAWLSKRICYIENRIIGESKDFSKDYCRID